MQKQVPVEQIDYAEAISERVSEMPDALVSPPPGDKVAGLENGA